MAAYVSSLGAKGGGEASAPQPAFDPLDPALVGDLEAIRAGKRTYMVYCSTCHGTHAWGSRYAPNLADGEWRNLNGSYGDIVRVVTLGVKGMMPAWYPRITTRRIREVAALVYYLQECPTEFFRSCLDPR